MIMNDTNKRKNGGNNIGKDNLLIVLDGSRESEAGRKKSSVF